MASLSFGNKKHSTIHDFTPPMKETSLFLSSSSGESSSLSSTSSSLKYSTIAVVMVVLLGTVVISSFTSSTSSSLDSSLLSSSSSVVSSQCKSYPEVFKAEKETFKEVSIDCIDIDALMAIEGFDRSVWDEGLDGDAADEITSSLVSILEETEDKIDELMGRKSGDLRTLKSGRCGYACLVCTLACDTTGSTLRAEVNCLAATAEICIFPGSACRSAQAVCRAPGQVCRTGCSALP